MGKVLVVDDDPAFLSEAESKLSEAGYEVLIAPDGKQAVRVLDKLREEIKLAIVDLALPGINGFELIGDLSRRPNSVKILAISAVFNNIQLESATAVGAHAAIRKPRTLRGLSGERLLSTVQQLIG